MSEVEVSEEPRATRSGLSRRDLIKRAGVVGAAAWAAPTIIDSIGSPAGAAFSPGPCPIGKGYAIMYSPPGNVDLVDRLPGTDGLGSITHGSCTNKSPDPFCYPPIGYTRTYAGVISLAVTQRNISHNINEQLNGPQQSLTVSLAQNSCCTIEDIKAYVHKFQSASTGFDCPANYCQQAGSTYLTKIVNNSKSWTIQPSNDGNLCSGGSNGNNVGIHWGSPNLDPDCVGYANQAQDSGQSFGYLLILLNCVGNGIA